MGLIISNINEPNNLFNFSRRMPAPKNERMGTLKTFAVKKFAWLLVIFTATLLFSACQEQNKYVEPPPPKVTIAQPLEEAVIDYLEFAGTTRAYEELEVRARVAGFLKSLDFTPGTVVKEGDVLFTIDPREYQAELNAAKAELASAEAQLKRAATELERSKKLFKQKAGSQADVVKWQGDHDVAKASVTRAKAKVERAALNLSYTKVTTSLTGRAGRNLVDVGNLVGEGEPTLLTTVTRYDPMYVYFNINERDLLKLLTAYRQTIKEKGIDPNVQSDAEAEIPVYLGLANEQGYPHKGILSFAESGVDPGTGTLQLRGQFPNKGNPPVLLPGLYTRIRFPIQERDKALLVTERAIGADQGGRYLLAVSKENVVEKRPIRIGQLMDGMRVIEEGVQAGDLIIVNGLQRARPGAKVDPEKTDMSSFKVSKPKTTQEPEKPKQ
jgi:RND family efflux transporter MFP subunit